MRTPPEEEHDYATLCFKKLFMRSRLFSQSRRCACSQLRICAVSHCRTVQIPDLLNMGSVGFWAHLLSDYSIPGLSEVPELGIVALSFIPIFKFRLFSGCSDCLLLESLAFTCRSCGFYDFRLSRFGEESGSQ